MRLCLAVLCLSFLFNNSEPKCRNSDPNCVAWASYGQCSPDSYVYLNCRLSCGLCDPNLTIPARYDEDYLRGDLSVLSKLVGRWRSEFDGKAKFPTIPVFTYGEELDFSIGDELKRSSVQYLNYSAVAWTINTGEELHSEMGFWAVKPGGKAISLTTTMSSGFTTVEEGWISGDTIELQLKSIGRISFGRDLKVTDISRTYRFLNDRTMEQSLSMATITHPLQHHTLIRYNKIFPS